MASLNATILSSTGVSLNVCKTESSTFLECKKNISNRLQIKMLFYVNFKKHLCRKHPSYVYNFHGSFSIGVVKNDLSWCNNSYEICSDNPSEYGDDDIASDDDNDHHDNDNLDETLILDDYKFW
jgi:hypothetical protein